MCLCFVAKDFSCGIQVTYSKEDETVTLSFPEELQVTFIVDSCNSLHLAESYLGYR